MNHQQQAGVMPYVKQPPAPRAAAAPPPVDDGDRLTYLPLHVQAQQLEGPDDGGSVYR